MWTISQYIALVFIEARYGFLSPSVNIRTKSDTGAVGTNAFRSIRILDELKTEQDAL